MFIALQNTLSLDDALDLAEIDEVGRSWRAAERRNEDRRRALVRDRDRSGGGR